MLSLVTVSMTFRLTFPESPGGNSYGSAEGMDGDDGAPLVCDSRSSISSKRHAQGDQDGECCEFPKLHCNQPLSDG